MRSKTSLMFVAALAVAGGAQAQVVLDGVADKSYGPAVVVGNTQTAFGDASQGTIDLASGSELNAGYAKIEDTDLIRGGDGEYKRRLMEDHATVSRKFPGADAEFIKNY